MSNEYGVMFSGAMVLALVLCLLNIVMGLGIILSIGIAVVIGLITGSLLDKVLGRN